MKKIFIEPRQKIYDFSIFEPLKIFFGEKINEKKLSSFFKEKFKFRNSLTLSHNRLGIYLAVRALINANKNEIILSPYTIIDVVNMVICAGGKPVFVDVDFPSIAISTNEVNKKINNNTAGIIVTHYQSYCKNLPEIKIIAQKYNVKIIEDCAIAFGTKINNKFVGSDSDISVFSFNITKYISTLTGGLLVCNDDNLFLKINSYISEFKINPFLYLLTKYIKALQIKIFTSKIVFNLFSRWVIKFTLDSNLKIFKNLVRTDGEKKLINKLTRKHRIFVTNYQRKEIYIKVSKYLEKNDQKIRLENYQFYQNNLSSISKIIIHKLMINDMNGAVSFPIFYSKRDRLYKFLILNGCDVTKYFYRDCSALEIFKKFNESCINSSRACDEVILLPVYPSYSRKSIEKNIETIKIFFKNNNSNL
jgi:dTDP-4-amino-4,6-dideoxygalactose transaminase